MIDDRPSEISIGEQINNVLDLFIAGDKVPKLITFLGMLSAYGDAPLNIAESGPSGSGKSYIALQIARLFPIHDVIKVGYASPAAFFHDHGAMRKDGTIEIDFRRKILVFLDSPHHALIERLRPVLSGDDAVINIKIADRNERLGLRTKNVQITGRPATIYCSTNSIFDAQELTRFLILSPEVSEDKLKAALTMTLRRSINAKIFEESLENNRDFQWMKKHINEVKDLNIEHVILPADVTLAISERFPTLKPRIMRDAQRICALAKAIALSNFPKRNLRNNILSAESEDVEAAFQLWSRIGEEQSLGLSPYLLSIFKNFVIPLGIERIKKGLFVNTISAKTGLQEWEVRQRVIPALVNSNLLVEDREGKTIFVSISAWAAKNYVRSNIGNIPDTDSHIIKLNDFEGKQYEGEKNMKPKTTMKPQTEPDFDLNLVKVRELQRAVFKDQAQRDPIQTDPVNTRGPANEVQEVETQQARDQGQPEAVEDRFVRNEEQKPLQQPIKQPIRPVRQVRRYGIPIFSIRRK